MNKTKIETCDYTWNPETGCDNKCFDGDCYAYQMVQRYGSKWGYDWTPRLHPDRLKEPLLLKEPSIIFAPSMGDLFTPSIKDEEIKWVLGWMGIAKWHRFMVQTKFAERLSDFNYPPNIWLGVSLCYARDIGRLDHLKNTDAKLKYAYCEPLLEDIDPDFTGIDWVVIGAKTGAHPFRPDFNWVRKLTLQCGEKEIPVFHKSNLGYELPPPIKMFPEKADLEWEGWKIRHDSENT